jgi:hypothetical protein
MLRMYCLHQWYGLADEALEDALYTSAVAPDGEASCCLICQKWSRSLMN